MKIHKYILSLITPLLGFHRNTLQKEIFGLNFQGPVGLGSGLDTDGEYFNALRKLGVSFIETGPLRPSSASTAIKEIMYESSPCILSVKIKRSDKSTEDNDILKDIVDTFSLLYDFTEMLVLDLEDECFDEELIREVATQCINVRVTYDQYKPIILSIGGNLTLQTLEHLADFSMLNGVDGFEICGIERIKHIYRHTKGRFPIIASGGLESPEKALEMLNSGASLLAITDELEKNGLGYVKQVLRFVEKHANNESKNSRRNI